MKRLVSFFTILLLSVSLTSFAQEIPIEDFVKQAQFNDAKLSPDGKHLAVSLPLGDRTALAILEKATLKPTYVYRFQENNHITDFYWANNERVVFQRNYVDPYQEQPITNGQIFAGNIDGSKNSIIFGYNATTRGSTATAKMKGKKGPDSSFGEILHTLPNNDKYIIISARHMHNTYDAPIRIMKLNVYTGKRSVITKTPFGNMHVTVNQNGEPAFASGVDPDGNSRSFLYKEERWIELDEKSPVSAFTPIAINSKGDKLYLETHPDGKTDALYEFDLNSQDLKKIFNHPISDIRAYIREPSTNVVVGAETMPDKFEYHYFEPDNEYAKLHKALSEAFQGLDITITSRTKDLSEMVILVQSDKNPGDFYLYNKDKNTLEYMMSRKQWLDPTKMAARTPINFKARDGKKIYGYLTLPPSAKKPSPLVTLVHGGPFGLQDSWFYDDDAQILANRGFAVLQVNYRGSGGYGLNYKKVAYRKRHSLIQQDIIDGTKWALGLPETSSDACIMGWSFGGYSAIMSPITEPDLFKCSIAAAGPYDARLQMDEADYTEVDSVNARAEQVYGNTDILLKEESPITYIDKFKTPVFIVHGGKDERVPPEHAFLLKKELDKRNVPYEWLFKEKEGHGFFKEENRIEFYEKSLEFLNKYLR